MKLFSHRIIKTKGQAAVALNFLLAVLVIGVLGVFSVELGRYLLAEDQLKSSVEAAALSCQITLASTGNPNSTANQTAAEQSALQLFQQNSILGQTLSSASLITLSSGQITPEFAVGPGEAQICFQFLDPITHLPINTSSSTQSVSDISSSSATGTVIQATAAYSYTPFFGQFLGMGNTQFTFQTSALSGIPQLDLVFVYDVSGAENTETPVTYFQRYWHPPYGISYLVPSPVGDPPTQAPTGGPLGPFCTTNPPLQGPNPLTPMFLDNTQNCSGSQLIYSEQSGSVTQLLSGSQASGAPPGNYPPPTSIWAVQNQTTYNGNPLTYYLPIPSSGIGGPSIVLVPLSGVYPTRISSIPSLASASLSGPTLPISGPPFPQIGLVKDYIAYVPNGSGPPATTSPGIAPGGVTQSTANSQASLILQNGQAVTYQFGGGSSYASTNNPLTPSGPHPTVDATNGSPSKALVAGFSLGGTVAGFDYSHIFTNSVVNIDNNATFQSTSVTYNGNTYSFPSLGSVIEASLGDLESSTAAQAAGENLSALGLTQANLQNGYYAAYMQAALASTQPMNTVANATIAFMNQLATASDVHFGCLTFNDYAGTNASSTAPSGGTAAPDNIASDYPYLSMNTNPDGTTGTSITDTYLLPNILLDASGNTTQSTITNVLPTIHTWGNCNVAGALNAALTELAPQVVGSTAASSARSTANKAIILITSQAPNVGLNGDTGASALTDAISQAQLANSAGIPIYIVSIAQSNTDDTNEDAAYNDSTNGIAATAGHGGKYYRIDWTNFATAQIALTSAFANIARHLVSVVH